jgi:hypothetical protein
VIEDAHPLRQSAGLMSRPMPRHPSRTGVA